MIFHLPIRVRLTLWYSLAIAAMLFSIGFGALWMVHSAIGELENNELQQRVRSVRRFLEARPKDETADRLHDSIAAAYDVSHGNKWLQVIDEQGNWLYRSSHVAAVYPNLVLPQQASEAGSYFTYEAESIHVRALIEPIKVKGVRYTVQTGLSLTKTLAVLTNFRIQLTLLATVGLLVSSLAGYFHEPQSPFTYRRYCSRGAAHQRQKPQQPPARAQDARRACRTVQYSESDAGPH